MERHSFYNAHHSPVGAFASFTLGYPGAKGGLGLEIGRPANDNVYIGLESRTPERYELLPFYGGGEDEAARYDVEKKKSGAATDKDISILPFAKKAIRRTFGAGTDTWQASDLTFSVYSPAKAVPDPQKAKQEALAYATLPAVIAELTVDNRRSARARTAFFGYGGSIPHMKMRTLDHDLPKGLVGIGQGTRTAIISDSKGVLSAQHFTLENILREYRGPNRQFGLGGSALLLCPVPARTKQTFRFAICFYSQDTVTTGMRSRYWYTRYFDSIEAVGTKALALANRIRREAQKTDALARAKHLNPDQQWMLAHAVRSYYGSTEFLDAEGKPFWVVNEGEYVMMNTFDLTVDQVFFEMRMNPWTVRNELDWFVDRYSYRDTIRFPGETKEYDGGLSFTHDMGVGNVLSRPGYSSYECFGLDGCFSHMTHEELVNWLLCGLVYAKSKDGGAWARKRLAVFRDCFESLCRRDHPDPKLRTGIMKLDSSRCQGGAEITTYDSLDVSLGQSRNNVYLAVKCWATYVGLADLFRRQRDARRAAAAEEQARRCAATLLARVEADGTIPAVIDEGVEARIIPAVEGLAFPWMLGLKSAVSPDGPYGKLIQALTRHLGKILKPGVCLFADGGWKLSSTSDNSWLSKIYLCQFVAREVLGLPWSAKGRKADAAHVQWLLHPQKCYHAWSDQCIAGEPKGSLYYPRGVTAVLWLQEKRRRAAGRR